MATSPRKQSAPPPSPRRSRRRKSLLPALTQAPPNRTLRELAPGWRPPTDPAARPVHVIAVEWVSFDTLLWRFDTPCIDVTDNVAAVLQTVLNDGAWGGPAYAAVYDAPPDVVGGVIAVYDPLTFEPGLAPAWRVTADDPSLVFSQGRLFAPQSGVVIPSAGLAAPPRPTTATLRRDLKAKPPARRRAA